MIETPGPPDTEALSRRAMSRRRLVARIESFGNTLVFVGQDRAAVARARDELRSIRAALCAIDRPAAVFLSDEWLALLDALEQSRTRHRESLPRTVGRIAPLLLSLLDSSTHTSGQRRLALIRHVDGLRCLRGAEPCSAQLLRLIDESVGPDSSPEPGRSYRDPALGRLIDVTRRRLLPLLLVWSGEPVRAASRPHQRRSWRELSRLLHGLLATASRMAPDDDMSSTSWQSSASRICVIIDALSAERLDDSVVLRQLLERFERVLACLSTADTTRLEVVCAGIANTALWYAAQDVRVRTGTHRLASRAATISTLQALHDARPHAAGRLDADRPDPWISALVRPLHDTLVRLRECLPEADTLPSGMIMPMLVRLNDFKPMLRLIECRELQSSLDVVLERLLEMDSHDGPETVNGRALIDAIVELEVVLDRETKRHIARPDSPDAEEGQLQSLTMDALTGIDLPGCRFALETLDRQWRAALAPGSSEREALPDTTLLRSLQVLVQCVEPAQPSGRLGEMLADLCNLQGVLLARHRSSRALSAPEIRQLGVYFALIGRLIDSAACGDDRSVEALQHSMELPRFARPDAAPSPGLRVERTRLGPSSSLGAVFLEEAEHILLGMQRVLEADSPASDAARVTEALARLHTLKGSARMAGWSAVHDYSHRLEGEVTGLAPGLARERLASGRRSLQSLIGQNASDGGASNGIDIRKLPVSEDRKDSLIDVPPAKPSQRPAVGTESTQTPEPWPDKARVPERQLTRQRMTGVAAALTGIGDALQQAQEARRDLLNALARHDRLPREGRLASRHELAEVLDDVAASSRNLEARLNDALSRQRKAVNTVAALDQSLIRTNTRALEDVIPRLADVLLDAEQFTDRHARLNLTGDARRIDNMLFRELLSLLEHLVRNALMHGIEPTGERLEMGKSTDGHIDIDCRTQGRDLLISVSDDGAGIDGLAIEEYGVQIGSAPRGSPDAQLDILQRPGFTTARDTGPLAGRGLGLTAVARGVARLGGTMSLASRSGEGTRFDLRIPRETIVENCIVARRGRQRLAFPTAQARILTRASHGGATDRGLLEGFGLSATLDERLIDKQSGEFGLGSLAGQHTRHCLELGSAGQRAYLLVDDVIGRRDVMGHPPGEQLDGFGNVLAAAVLADGLPVLMIDLPALLAAVHDARESAPTAAGVRGDRVLSDPRSARSGPRASALVVDDSPTMRLAASQYLGACGFQCAVARDGVEALDYLAHQPVDLLVVDVEMPRMDGFELLSRLSSTEQRPPRVIVTSSHESRLLEQRARSLGASSVLSKPWQKNDFVRALAASGITATEWCKP